MEIAMADIVCSAAGRDRGKLFAVVATEGDYLLLVDGKGRRVERPKRKKRKHVRFVARDTGRLADKIMRSEKITNSEIRKALAGHCGGLQPDQEG